MRKSGFTLAEVLITLGIIGVVAAMTIPTLISNTNGAQFKTAYKKALSTLNQAVLMNLALDDYDLASLVTETSPNADGSVSKSMSNILKNRMQSATRVPDYKYPTTIKYSMVDYVCTTPDISNAASACNGKTVGTKVTEQKSITPTGATWELFTFADGTSFAYLKAAAGCSTKTTACIGFIDVNGATTPNTVIACDAGTVEGGTGATACKVSSSGVTDVYPVFMYGQTIEPASDAARAVLFGK